MTDDTPTLTRRQYSAGIGSAATSPLLFSNPLISSDTLAPLVTGDADAAITHGDDSHPSVIVRYSDGKKDSLTSWIDGSDDREVLHEHDTLNAISVIAPWSDLGVRNADSWLPTRVSGGLQANSYVESIDLNQRLAYPDPISLDSEDVFDPDVGWSVAAQLTATGTDVPDGSGLAFDDDAPEATMREARQLAGADDSVIDGVDTSSVRVAVIDTGANVDSPIFEDGSGNTRVLDASENLITGETVGEDGFSAVADGSSSKHGTWVSSAIAGAPSDAAYGGYAQAAELLVLRALDDGGRGPRRTSSRPSSGRSTTTPTSVA